MEAPLANRPRGRLNVEWLDEVIKDIIRMKIN